MTCLLGLAPSGRESDFRPESSRQDRVTPELLPRLGRYSWPGNVRENALESAVALSADGTIDLSLLPDSALPPQPGPAPTRFKEQVAAYERGLIVAALDAARGNQSEAARLLDMGRTTLQDKMRKYGLSRAEPGDEKQS